MMNKEKKKRIIAEVATDSKNFPNGVSHSKWLKIPYSTYKAVFRKMDFSEDLDEEKWVEIATKMRIALKGL